MSETMQQDAPSSLIVAIQIIAELRRELRVRHEVETQMVKLLDRMHRVPAIVGVAGVLDGSAGAVAVAANGSAFILRHVADARYTWTPIDPIPGTVAGIARRQEVEQLLEKFHSPLFI